MKKLIDLSYIFLLEMKRVLFGKGFIAEVDITDNCNLRCGHCYHFHGKDDFRKEELPLDVWERRFNELHRAGIRLILLVGGEPALRKDVLMLAHSTFLLVHVITNGTIKIPKEFNHRLYVSIDGCSKTNDSIRGKGVFSRVIRNYSGDKRVVINMTVMKDNYKELEDVVKIAKRNGFRGVVCNIYTATGVDTPMTIKEERKEIIGELRRIKSLYPKDFLLSKSMIKWYEHPDHRNSCYWGDKVPHFDVSWRRRRCFGNNADCSNCGCLAGAFQSPVGMFRHARELVRLGFI
jgi:MoaA/NifB/PqqE/SkfB family radical SAM enzyme